MEIDYNWLRQPALLIDEAKCRNNIHRMIKKAEDAGAILRPHFKTHQSGQIGEWFRSAGVQRITVSSVSMASYFADFGWNDITIAFPVNILEINEINRILERVKLHLLVESVEVAEKLNDQLILPAEVMIKVDSGAHRTGIPLSETSKILALAEKLAAMPKLHLRGLLTHAGHTYKAKGRKEITEIAFSSRDKMFKIKELINLKSFTLSWGDTPSCSMLENLDGFDEWRPGNFVFYDLMQYHIGSCKLEDIALQMVCPVVAVHEQRNELVIYGGAVHFSKDFIAAEDGFRLYGYIQRFVGEQITSPVPGAWLAEVSQEHGIVKLPKGMAGAFRPGDLLSVLPIHSCLAVSSMRTIYGQRGERYCCMPSLSL